MGKKIHPAPQEPKPEPEHKKKDGRHQTEIKAMAQLFAKRRTMNDIKSKSKSISKSKSKTTSKTTSTKK